MDATRERNLMAQVTYKLQDYKTTLQVYTDLLKEADEDETGDIATNMLACASNMVDEFQNVDSMITAKGGFEKTYEYWFNLSMVQMHLSLYTESMNSLMHSF